MSVSGYTPGTVASMATWNAALLAMLAGSSPARIMIVGDSTSCAYMSGQPYLKSLSNAHWTPAAQLRDILLGLNIPAREDFLFGSRNCGAALTAGTSQYGDHDTRLRQGTARSRPVATDEQQAISGASSTNTTSAGNDPYTNGVSYIGRGAVWSWKSTASNQALYWTSDRPWNVANVYYFDEVGSRSFTYKVLDDYDGHHDDTTPTVVSTTGSGGTGPGHMKVSTTNFGAQRAGRILAIYPTTPGTTGDLRIAGVEFINTTSPEIGICTCAANGSACNDFIDNSETVSAYAYSSGPGVAATVNGGTSGTGGTAKNVSHGGLAALVSVVDPDIVIFNLSVNDLLGGTSVADFKGRRDWLRQKAATRASILHMVHPDVSAINASGSATGNIANQGAIQQAIRDIATHYGDGYLDMSARWGAFDTINDATAFGMASEQFMRLGRNGWYGDYAHPNRWGNQDIAKALAQILIPASVIAKQNNITAGRLARLRGTSY